MLIREVQPKRIQPRIQPRISLAAKTESEVLGSDPMDADSGRVGAQQPLVEEAPSLSREKRTGQREGSECWVAERSDGRSRRESPQT